MLSTKEQTRERVLRAGKQLFSCADSFDVNMDDVAKAAGIGRATLYRHFGNRDEVLLAVIEIEAREVAARVEKSIRKFDTPGDYIIEGMLKSDTEISTSPLLKGISQGPNNARVNRVLFDSDRLTNIGLELMSPVVQRAQERGELKTDMESGLLVEWIMRLLFSLLAIPSPQLKSKRAKRSFLRAIMLPVLEGGDRACEI